MSLNPVERRLVYLCGQWIDFRQDPSRRLLVWRAPESALRLIECFFEAQKHEGPYSSGDLFVVFRCPFEYSIQYSRALKEALLGSLEASREELRLEGLDAQWTFDPASTEDSPAGVLEVFHAFATHYQASLQKLAVVFLPSIVAQPEHMEQWVRRWLEAGPSEMLRGMVLVTAPGTVPPVLSTHPLVQVQNLALDPLAAAQETFAREATNQPDSIYRTMLMSLVALCEKGTANQVKTRSADVLNFAQKRGWTDQQVAVHVIVAGAFMKESRYAEAIQSYQRARQAADIAMAAGHPAGPKLVLQTWFGQAGAEFAAGNGVGARSSYDQAGAVAQKAGDLPLCIEALRMAARCSSQLKDVVGAKQRAQAGLEVGTGMKPEERALTTLPVLLVDLLRLLDRDRVLLMQQVKRTLHADVLAARNVADLCGQNRAAGTRPPDPAAVEQTFQKAVDEAFERATEALEAHVAQAADDFQALCSQGSALFESGWMLENDIALPAQPEAAELPGPEGGIHR